MNENSTLGESILLVTSQHSLDKMMVLQRGQEVAKKASIGICAVATVLNVTVIWSTTHCILHVRLCSYTPCAYKPQQNLVHGSSIEHQPPPMLHFHRQLGLHGSTLVHLVLVGRHSGRLRVDGPHDLHDPILRSGGERDHNRSIPRVRRGDFGEQFGQNKKVALA